jgi:hypothetical protein
MKKQQVRKIVLSKETLRQMDGDQLAAVLGAVTNNSACNDTCLQLCHGTTRC